MKILVPGKTLPDQRRTRHLAIGNNQLTVSLPAKRQMSNACDRQRIKDTEQYRGQQCKTDRDLQFITQHGVTPNQDKPSPVKQMSMSLIPMKGTITPPTP